MTVHVVDSNRARIHWRDVLDAARAGVNTVIEHYNKPTAAVIPYADFVALQEELDDLQAARRAGATYEAWQRDSRLGRPYAEVREELVAEGLLDA